MIGVAKGEGRKPGLESLIFPDGREPVQLAPEHPALHLIQEIRDEAHRFAIAGHRAQRSKTRRTSTLDEIAGIGPSRKRALLHEFGTAKAVSGAALADLMKVEGISEALAQSIYDHFRDQ